MQSSTRFLAIDPLVWRSILLGGLSSIVATIAQPTQAAERIYVSFGALERSISVASLEKYATQGTIDEDLAVYARYAKTEELKQLREALQARAYLETVTVAQFLYSPQGEVLLKRLGQVFQPESRLTGFKALRAALILAAADPEGITLLNVLRKFPTRGLRIDVRRSLDIVGDLEGLVRRTKQATEAVAQQAEQELKNQGLDTSQLADLRLGGPYSWEKQTLTFADPSRRSTTARIDPSNSDQLPTREELRGRIFSVDVYLPKLLQQSRPAPVIVISHGLGSDRTSFSYLAQHLASYGFAVLVPEHPGSNAKQIQALLNGTADEAAEPAEFINRPLDVTYLLDQLERQNQFNPTFQGRLNLQQVGVIGQSFGGYTALALAGAPINAQDLQSACQSLEETLNLSLLLQCRALELLPDLVSVQDQRVKAAIAINPVTSAVFGQAGLSQIQVPTMIVSANADTVAPAVLEQIKPFTWLTTQNKYLVLMERATHFSVIGGAEAGQGGGLVPEELVGPNPAITHRYMNALSTAFFQVYVAGKPEFVSYLTAAYAKTLSEDLMPLRIVQSMTEQSSSHQVNPSLSLFSGLDQQSFRSIADSGN